MNKNTISLLHGNGGSETKEMIEEVFLKAYGNDVLARLGDAALLQSEGERLAFTTDAYTVSPLFFAGGNIGSLAINGTVNDLAVSGATPRYLTASFVIEEGTAFSELSDIVAEMAAAARKAGVKIVSGDTKVVEKGGLKGMVITTSGIGFYPEGRYIPQGNIEIGDVVLINGYVGDHGMAILSAREEFPITHNITSDCAPVNRITELLLNELPLGSVKIMRDPTRGGLATVINEFVTGKEVGMVLDESAVPVRDGVRTLCEMTGFDHLYLANEGKVVAIVDAPEAEKALSLIRSLPEGEAGAIIGEITDDTPGKVFAKTVTGGRRIVDLLQGEMLPRIC